jgi:uncharacterized protein
MKTHNLLAPFLLAIFAIPTSELCAQTGKIKVLIIDGQNNHQWATTTPLLKAILEDAGVFQVDVSTTPPSQTKPKQKQKAGAAKAPEQTTTPEDKVNTAALWAKWRPRLSDYQVIVSNYNGDEWPEEVRTAFVSYVKNGGGFVSYHAADNSFANWADYNEMIGLGGWGGRNAKSGPYLRLRDGEWKKTEAPGPCGGHGAREEFMVETFAPEHPIMKGLPAKWMHTQDELYHSLRGPAKELSVLGSGLSDKTNEQEPLLMAIKFGEGRVFHTTLGHYVEALNGLGFQVTFSRGTEWAATGKVTIPAPKPGELTAGPKAAVREIKPAAAR